jgi:ornithine carbamoyltransferase
VNKDILALVELDRADFSDLFERAAELKTRHRQGIRDRSLLDKSVGLIFDKPSTRTRLSFEVATIQLGGTPIFIAAADTQMARNEPIEDTGRVLSRYLDAVAVRTFSQSLVEKLAAAADIPVINALTDDHHPCQILSDLMTVLEFKGGLERLEELKIAWIGDGNNMANSWIDAAGVLGFEMVLACPDGYAPNSDVIARATANNNRIHLVRDPFEAAAGADVINTDVWASMGQEHEADSRKNIFAPYCVDAGMVGAAAKDVIVMHCLPAHRGEEITAEVLDGEHSVVWDQAENKLHMHKAILDLLISGQQTAS